MPCAASPASASRGPTQRSASVESERIAVARADESDLAEKVAEPWPQRGEIPRRVEPGDRRGPRRGLGPDDRRGIARQRQDRQRTRRHEELVGHPAVRQRMRHGADQRRLAVVPAAPADARPPRHLAVAAVAGDEERRPERGAARKRHRHRAGHCLLADHRARRPMRDQRRARHRHEQRGPQIAVLQDVPHRAFVDLLAVEMQEEPRRALAGPAVADLDRLDRLRPAGQPAPEPERAEEPPRAERQRIGAAVEPRLGPGLEATGVEYDAGEPALRQRERQHRAVEPAADDDHIAVVRHCAGQYRPSQPIVQPPPPG